MPRKSKAEPWEGDSSDDNNWEPETENLDGSDLLSNFEESRTKKDEAAPSKDAAEEGTAPRKRGRRKKRIQEIEKPRGIDRGLQPEKILAAQLFNSSVYFLVKWHDCLELDVVPGKDMNQNFPEFVIQYYESCVPFSVRYKIGRVPRVAPELPVEEPETPMDVSENLEPPALPMPSELESTLNEQPVEQPSLPDMSLPDISLPSLPMPDVSLPLPDVPATEESQAMEVPVN